MIKQTVLGFKTERAEERLTSHSGLVPYYEFMKAIGVEEAVNRHMPKPGQTAAQRRTGAILGPTRSAWNTC